LPIIHQPLIISFSQVFVQPVLIFGVRINKPSWKVTP
jgi:hypothetical protein